MDGHVVVVTTTELTEAGRVMAVDLLRHRALAARNVHVMILPWGGSDPLTLARVLRYQRTQSVVFVVLVTQPIEGRVDEIEKGLLGNTFALQELNLNVGAYIMRGKSGDNVHPFDQVMITLDEFDEMMQGRR